jgi:ribonuclease HI
MIIAFPDKKWYKNITPLIGPFLDIHVIAYFPPDTLTYEDPITPTPLITEPQIETTTLYIYCVHHKNYPIHTHLTNHTFHQLLQHLNIQHTQLLYAPPTPLPIQVNNCKIWNSLTYPPIITFPHLIPPLPHYQHHPPPKFPPCYNYYTDGSFKPPKQRINGTWKPETAGYGIYNPIKHIHISARLLGLQNILRAELLAIHHTLQILLAQFPHEPAHIFTDSLNSIYLLLTQIKHPPRHTSHPDKILLQTLVNMLSLRTQPTLIAKVKAHVNIQGNESVDKLAKQGTKLPHRLPQSLHEHAYSTLYHLHKDTWPNMDQTPHKGPIRHLLPYITQHDKTHNLELIAQNFHNIFKWTNDPNIDPDTSTNFWTHPSITDSQRTCILKFRYNQYMGNARKQLFFGPTLFPQITYSLCNSTEPDTWKHVLLSCTQQHLHALRIKRHNKAVYEFCKLLLSCQNTRCYILMNTGIYNNSPPDNTVPT